MQIFPLQDVRHQKLICKTKRVFAMSSTVKLIKCSFTQIRKHGGKESIEVGALTDNLLKSPEESLTLSGSLVANHHLSKIHLSRVSHIPYTPGVC